MANRETIVFTQEKLGGKNPVVCRYSFLLPEDEAQRRKILKYMETTVVFNRFQLMYEGLKLHNFIDDGNAIGYAESVYRADGSRLLFSFEQGCPAQDAYGHEGYNVCSSDDAVLLSVDSQWPMETDRAELLFKENIALMRTCAGMNNFRIMPATSLSMAG